jgi:2-succinyl-5-enolpyruvyl-6-hydroxy-3-cyclohexene-1-carboxylate synthase
MTPDSSPTQPAGEPACTGVHWCLALLDGLLAGGARHLVLSPGSRSTPVVLAAQQRPALTLNPILDERSAAFYALGLARASGRPVALLATSGSAPAHWYPAVMEANEAAVPLILLSADRPPELRGWGANQTTDQTRLFGTQVREFHDPGAPVDSPAMRQALAALGRRAAAVSQGRRPGPVHINLPLREPLVPHADCGLEAPAPDPLPPTSSTGPTPGPIALPPGLKEGLRGRGLIYCGPDNPRPGFPVAVLRCAAALGVPVLVDPLSELRFGAVAGPGPSPLISRYKSLVRNPQAAQALRPDWVLRFGRAPISRTLLEWLPGIPLLLVDPAERWSDPAHDLGLEQSLHLPLDPVALCETLAADPPHTADPSWLIQWTRAEARLTTLAQDYLAAATWCEAHLIRDLVDRLPAGEGLLCANSLPIRQFETWSGTREASLAVFGNRGLSGIDGQLSTLAGLNAAGLPTTGLLGDLSFLHDLSGLLLASRLVRPCIVVNNGGGRIFDYLPQQGLPDYERLWRTPRPVDIGALASTFGLSHRRVSDAPGWQAALSEGLAGTPGLIIEVMIDAARSQDVHLQFRQRVATADLLAGCGRIDRINRISKDLQDWFSRVHVIIP